MIFPFEAAITTYTYILSTILFNFIGLLSFFFVWFDILKKIFLEKVAWTSREMRSFEGGRDKGKKKKKVNDKKYVMLAFYLELIEKLIERSSVIPKANQTSYIGTMVKFENPKNQTNNLTLTIKLNVQFFFFYYYYYQHHHRCLKLNISS